MKVFYVLAIVVMMAVCGCQKGNPKLQSQPVAPHRAEEANYELYPTQNMHIFLKLDTRNGRVWMVQYHLKDVQGCEVAINEQNIVNGKSGRFKMYPTQNIWNFMLLDTEEGKTYQVQWGMEQENCMLIPISQ